MEKDTIAAIATGLSNAGIGIIRISGEAAIDVADRVYRSKSGKKASETGDHRLCLGSIFSNEGDLDEVLLSVMRAPHSYTGEDTVEINCHGGLYICKMILKLVTDAGARLAEPGEFTKRAFLNGKMDLSRASAVMDLIRAENDFALKNSLAQLKGSVYGKISSLRERILHELAFIEAALDDPDNYELDGYPEKLEETVSGMDKEIGLILSASKNGFIRKQGIRTAILGKPNAGKSSILNLLSGRDSAIVSEIAGTTRDTIEESVRLGEFVLNLVDTAGIRDSADPVERIGVERARKLAEDADLSLFVCDSASALDQNDMDIISLLHGRRVIILYNKTDLTPVTPEEKIKELLDAPFVCFSATEGKGPEELQAALCELFSDGHAELNEELVITDLRQQKELEAAQESLRLVGESIRDCQTEDIFAVDLTDAYRHLGYIIGEEMEDDVIDRVFSEFCMGK